MRAFTVIDRCMRIVGAITAVASLLLVLVLAVMANDAGNAAGERAGDVVLLGGTALAAWVCLCCLKPRLFTGLFPGGVIFTFMLVTLPRYLYALAGLGWCLMVASARLGLLKHPIVVP